LGRDLLNVAFDWLGENMPGPIWLGVFSGNIKAQDVYAARGFVKVGEYEFMVGDHRDHEFIMRRG
jgi:RimJ/RimL family protein N-acetyltransferase